MQKNVFVEQAEQIIQPFLHDLEQIVNIDSGTYTKAGIDRVGSYVQQRFHEFGFSTYFDEQMVYGNHLIATHYGSNPAGPRLLFIGHIDTVFPEQEAQRRPFTYSERNGVRIARGPGILDMKSGVLMGMYALHLLIQAQQANYQSVTFICNSDEEIGSLSSKPLIERLAREADVAMILEPGRMLNTVVSARKGIGNYRVEVQGIAAHAGVEPHHGRNAILELAHKVIELQAINGTIRGATVNVGVMHGGERTNIVPDFAYCEIDVRVSDRDGLHAVEETMRRITTRNFIDGTRTTLSGGIRSLPFERNDRSARLVQLVREAGHILGLKIQDVGSGGASDANTTAALGLPTIDGLGAGGGLAHNPDEYIELDYLPLRIALLCELVQRICTYYREGKRL